MAKLSDGRELTPDFTKITVREYRLLFANDDIDVEDEIIGKVYGLSVAELRELPYYDYRMLTKEFQAAARDPAGYSPN
jgi:hypothetical protein